NRCCRPGMLRVRYPGVEVLGRYEDAHPLERDIAFEVVDIRGHISRICEGAVERLDGAEKRHVVFLRSAGQRRGSAARLGAARRSTGELVGARLLPCVGDTDS